MTSEEIFTLVVENINLFYSWASLAVVFKKKKKKVLPIVEVWNYTRPSSAFLYAQRFEIGAFPMQILHLIGGQVSGECQST